MSPNPITTRLPNRSVAIVLFTVAGFLLGVAIPVSFFSWQKSRASVPKWELPVPPGGDPVPTAVSQSLPAPAKQLVPPMDWSLGKSANLTSFATQCLASVAEDPEAFAKSLAAHAGSLALTELETAVWALSQKRPDLGAIVVTGMKSPWLCGKTAPLIAAGIAAGDDDLRREVLTTLKLPASARSQLESVAAADRAEADGAWAVQRLASTSSAREKLSLLKGLARTNPEHALELAKEIHLPQAGMSALLGEVAATDPGAALNLAGKLEKPAAASFLYFLMSNGKMPVSGSEIKALQPMIEKYGNNAVSGPYYSGSIISGMVQTLLNRDPAQAAELFEKVPENQRDALLPSVALAVSGQDWRKALSWIQNTQTESTVVQERMYGMLPYQWAAAAPENLQETLTREPNLPGREQFFDSLQNQYRQKGEITYKRWIKSLPPTLRSMVK